MFFKINQKLCVQMWDHQQHQFVVLGTLSESLPRATKFYIQYPPITIWDIVAIRKLERQVRKAPHCGSKQ